MDPTPDKDENVFNPKGKLQGPYPRGTDMRKIDGDFSNDIEGAAVHIVQEGGEVMSK